MEANKCAVITEILAMLPSRTNIRYREGVFSKVDLRLGHHQIKIMIKKEDIPKTMFVSRYGHHENLIVTFGSTNAPTIVMNLMNKIFIK
jgi:hypothetical protein